MFEPPLDFIARTIPGGPISIKTLIKNFGDTIKFAKINAINHVSMSLFQVAITPGPGQARAAIFLLKEFGWHLNNDDSPAKERSRKAQNSRGAIKANIPASVPAQKVQRIKLSLSEQRPRRPSGDDIERLRKLLAKS